MLPDFELPSWEMPLLAETEPACAPATRRLEVGRGRQKTVYFVREAANKLGIVKTLLQRDNPEAPTLVLQDIIDPVNHLPIKKLPDDDIKTAIANKNWTRFIYLDNHLKLLKQGAHPDHTFSVTGSNQTRWHGRDNWNVPYEFLLDGRPGSRGWGELLPATRIEELIGKARCRQKSDCNFGLRWAGLTVEEKLHWLYEVECGSFDECQQVLRWFVISGPWWDSAITVNLPADIAEEDPSKRKHPIPLAQSQLLVLPSTQQYPQWMTFSASQRQLLSVFDRYFALHYNKECLSHQRSGLHRFAPWMIYIYQVPTHHERLEARLQLRDWLRDKVPPEEIPALLGETA